MYCANNSIYIILYAAVFSQHEVIGEFDQMLSEERGKYNVDSTH